jgi:hypothetical protein
MGHAKCNEIGPRLQTRRGCVSHCGHDCLHVRRHETSREISVLTAQRLSRLPAPCLPVTPSDNRFVFGDNATGLWPSPGGLLGIGDRRTVVVQMRQITLLHTKGLASPFFLLVFFFLPRGDSLAGLCMPEKLYQVWK